MDQLDPEETPGTLAGTPKGKQTKRHLGCSRVVSKICTTLISRTAWAGIDRRQRSLRRHGRQNGPGRQNRRLYLGLPSIGHLRTPKERLDWEDRR